MNPVLMQMMAQHISKTPPITFSEANGADIQVSTSAGEANYSIVASQAVTWVWTKTGGSGTPASGSSSTTFTASAVKNVSAVFNIQAQDGGGNVLWSGSITFSPTL